MLYRSTLIRNNICNYIYVSDAIQLDLQGPVFSHEPPHKVEFSNSTGGHVECSGHGSPPPEVSKLVVYEFTGHMTGPDHAITVRLPYPYWDLLCPRSPFAIFAGRCERG